MGSPARLVLHLDINKTLVMSDPVQGVSLPKMVNALLSECCYGTHAPLPATVEPGALPALAKTWHPAPPLEPSAEPLPGLVTYGDFLEDTLRMPKPDRNELKGAFTNPGGVGEVFRPFYHELLDKMRLPPGTVLPGGDPDAEGDRYCFLLPSFFRLVLSLRGRDVTLVFRTFGTELAPVAAEYNAFCAGAHPLYPAVRLDGTGGAEDWRLHAPHATGKFHRTATDCLLAFVDAAGLVDVAEGPRQIWDALHARIAAGCRAIGIRDHWAYWAAEGESDASGKLLLVDASNPAPAYHHIVFDDNVHWGRYHIVDVRDRTTGQTIPYEAAINRWVVKVEPLLCIRDPDYFVKALQRCEENLRTCPFCQLPTM
eukprot:EG_transcript_13094